MNELKAFLDDNINNPGAVKELYLQNKDYYDAIVRQNRSKLGIMKFMYPKYYRILQQAGII
jgi:hypothetical protein